MVLYNTDAPVKVKYRQLGIWMRILLIEDDEDVARVVTTGLGEAGHVVIHANNGPDGVALAESQRFDVMILDRQLPGGVDSADLLASLRGHGVVTPVLFLSGLGGLNDWIKGLEVGGDDYIVKPFTLSDLKDRVEKLHERAGLAAQEVDQPGG
jgi:two-component system OmpR family response regulator